MPPDDDATGLIETAGLEARALASLATFDPLFPLPAFDGPAALDFVGRLGFAAANEQFAAETGLAGHHRQIDLRHWRFDPETTVRLLASEDLGRGLTYFILSAIDAPDHPAVLDALLAVASSGRDGRGRRALMSPEAVVALGRNCRTHPGVVSALGRLIVETDSGGLRSECLAAIGRIGGHSTAALDVLLALVTDESLPAPHRHAARAAMLRAGENAPQDLVANTRCLLGECARLRGDPFLAPGSHFFDAALASVQADEGWIGGAGRPWSPLPDYLRAVCETPQLALALADELFAVARQPWSGMLFVGGTGPLEALLATASHRDAVVAFLLGQCRASAVAPPGRFDPFRAQCIILTGDFPAVFAPHAAVLDAVARDPTEHTGHRWQAALTLRKLAPASTASVDSLIDLIRVLTGSGGGRAPQPRHLLPLVELFRTRLRDHPDARDAALLGEWVDVLVRADTGNRGRVEALAALEWVAEVLDEVAKLQQRFVRRDADREELGQHVFAEFALLAAADPFLGIRSFQAAPVKKLVRRHLANAVRRFIRRELEPKSHRRGGSEKVFHVPTDPEVLADTVAVEDHFGQSRLEFEERLQGLRTALSKELSAVEELVLRLRYYSEQSRQQIIDERGLSNHTVRTAETSALAKLARALRDRAGE